jgi:hypothetical protein
MAAGRPAIAFVLSRAKEAAAWPSPPFARRADLRGVADDGRRRTMSCRLSNCHDRVAATRASPLRCDCRLDRGAKYFSERLPLTRAEPTGEEVLH